MEILKYAASLLPNFKKDRLLEDARIVRTELQNSTTPSYKQAMDVLNNKVVSKEIKAIEKEYFRAVGATNSKGMVADIWFRMLQVEKIASTIEGLVEKDFENEVVVAGITLYKVSLIKTLELISFSSRYSLRLLNYLYILETEATTGEQSYLAKQLSKGEINELRSRLSVFGRILKTFTEGNRDFVKTIRAVPDVLVNEDTEAALATFGALKIDPAGVHNLQGFAMNPIYHIGLIVAEYQSNKYKENKELKSNLELRLMNLVSIRDTGQADPGVEREIEMVQSRIDKLSESIRKQEESVGL